MIAPAKAGKFTLYDDERQGFAAERATAQLLSPPQTVTRPHRSRSVPLRFEKRGQHRFRRQWQVGLREEVRNLLP